MSRSPAQVVRDFLALSGGELLAKLAGFAAFAYLARALGPESYGAVELAVALVMFFTIVVDFGFGPIGARELARDPAQAPGLASAIPAARLPLALGGVAALWLCAGLLDQPPETRTLIRIYALSLLAAPWTLNWLFQGLDLMTWVAPAQAARMFVFALGVFLFVSGPADLWMVGVVEIGAALALAVYYLVAQSRRVAPPRLSFDRPQLVRLGAEALPVGASRVLWAMGQWGATVLVAILASGAEVAWFGAAHRIVAGLGAFVFLYHFNLYPQIARTAGDRTAQLQDVLRPSFRATAWLGVLGALAGTALAEPLCRLVYGEPFAAAAPAFAVLSWLLPISLLGAHARFALIAYAQQRSELAANAVGAAVAVGLGLVWIPPFGAVGAAAAMLASGFATWGVAQVFARRHLGRIPFLGPLARPALVAAGALALSSWLPLEGRVVAGLVAIGVYVAAAPMVEPALLRDLLALWRARAETTDGGSP